MSKDSRSLRKNATAAQKRNGAEWDLAGLVLLDSREQRQDRLAAGVADKRDEGEQHQRHGHGRHFAVDQMREGRADHRAA